MHVDLGERIQRWRESLDMTRPDLADAVGVTVAAVYQWEGNGKTGKHQTTPTHETLEKIVRAFKTTLAEFFATLPPKRKARAS